MIVCQHNYLEQRAAERGYTLDEVMGCVVGKDGDQWTIDTDHPAYPRPRRGLGDMVAAGLAAVGITPDRVERVIGGPCGCKERQAALNRVRFPWSNPGQ